jgi:hypothetical protein
MSPWEYLNSRGKVLAVCCVINMIVSIVIASSGSYLAVVPCLMAAYCGVMTYHPFNQIFFILTDQSNERETDDDKQ